MTKIEESEKSMEEVIQSIITIGGFGYLNYWLFVRMRDRDTGDNIDRKFLITTMSSFNYLIYMILNYFLGSMIWSIIGAVVIALVMTIVLHYVLDIVYSFSNKLRVNAGLSKQVDMHLWDMMFEEDKPNRFIFDFSGNMITSGVINSISGDNEEKSLILASFVGRNDKRPKTEAELMMYLDKNDIQSYVYVNFDLKIKIIYF